MATALDTLLGGTRAQPGREGGREGEGRKENPRHPSWHTMQLGLNHGVSLPLLLNLLRNKNPGYRERSEGAGGQRGRLFRRWASAPRQKAVRGTAAGGRVGAAFDSRLRSSLPAAKLSVLLLV